MTDLSPSRGRSAPPLVFNDPAWLGLSLRIVLIRGEPWFVAPDLLALPAFGKPSHQHGATYARTPPEHLRRVSRARYGLAGRGPRKAVLVSLDGLRRLLRLQRAAERRMGLSGPADAFESFLMSDILPAVEGASALWEQTAPGGAAIPAEVETVAQKLRRLEAIDSERLPVAHYVSQRDLTTSGTERRDLGTWAAEHCRAEGITFDVHRGVGYYPRRVLDLGARLNGLGADRT